MTGSAGSALAWLSRRSAMRTVASAARAALGTKPIPASLGEAEAGARARRLVWESGWMGD